jgi:hypothetical protein
MRRRNARRLGFLCGDLMRLWPNASHQRDRADQSKKP